MIKNKADSTYLLPAHDLDRLIQALRGAGYQVVGPIQGDGAILYDEVISSADLPQGWTENQEKGRYRLDSRPDDAYFGFNLGPHSWKKYLFPPKRPVFRADKTDDSIQFLEVTEPPPSLAFLGVRSCELHAMAIQDRVFGSGDYQNEDYSRRRNQSFIVAINCTTAAPTCFCSSMNTGPVVTLDCDLELTEIIDPEHHFFLINSGSADGDAIMARLSLQPATPEQKQLQDKAINKVRQQLEEGPRSFDSSDLQELLYRNYESPAWDEVADRCLSCANCTMVCPTCFCTSEVDTTDLSGQHAERWQQWDSCFNGDFSYMHGGSVRPSTRSRYRQWMTHKLATWHDQFDSSGCVGCGRCVTWCPVGIDITEQINRIRIEEES